MIDFGWRWPKVTLNRTRKLPKPPFLEDGPGQVAYAPRGEAMDRSSEEAGRFAELMRSAQDGDAAAYAQLLNRVIPLVRGAVVRHCKGLQPADIEDLVQDILLSLHTARATYDPARPFLPWLMAIARNRMVDGARKSGRRSAREITVERLEETFSSAETNSTLEDYGDPDALKQAMGQLPGRQRDAVEMLKLREMSLKEASAASGMTVGSLKVAAYRGVAALRRALGARGARHGPCAPCTPCGPRESQDPY